jgi:fermentation-respiration switch protein FrsA (DUF1100 family)
MPYVYGIVEEVPAFAEGLPGVRGIPILLLNGTADTTTPVQMARELAPLLAGSELIELPGVTHMGPMLLKKEAALAFGHYATFLEKVLDGAAGEGTPPG